jgi:hypothetical protein
MTDADAYIARLLFQSKVLQISAQAFEDFFVKIMECHSIDFHPVKPQGPHGDKKNDGFNYRTGEFYQCYAPEELSENIPKAVKKLSQDFFGLYGYWDSLCKINVYNFVINDKYRGSYPDIHAKLAELRRDYTHTNFVLFRTKNLEDIFLSLPKTAIQGLVGFYPDPLTITISTDDLQEVINYLLEHRSIIRNERIPVNPNFNNKIAFNRLSEHVEVFLKFGRFQTHEVEAFFSYNGEYSKAKIQQKFIGLYQEAIQELASIEADNKNDIIFTRILEKACPNQDKKLESAVIVLMAYYFESCDIFEEPK